MLINNPLQSLGDAQSFYNQLLQQLSAKALLDNFPYNEFGFLEGKIIKCSTLPEAAKGNNGGQSQQGAIYRIYVQLPDTLITSYKKNIPFNPEMTATARIITKDRNLLQRLVAGVAKMDK